MERCEAMFTVDDSEGDRLVVPDDRLPVEDDSVIISLAHEDTVFVVFK